MKGIIFDVDGTLWDSTEVVAKAWNQAIAEQSDLKLTLTAADMHRVFGKTMDDLTATLFPMLSYEERTRLGYLCFDYENRLLETEYGILYPGVREAFQILSQRARLFIVSNCQKGYIEVLLKTSGLSPYVTDHLCFGDTRLPKEGTIRLLMERNQITDAVYVGDTQGDYDSCQKAGVPFIFAAYGFGDVPAAQQRITKIMELTEIL